MRNRDLRPAAKANPTIQQAFERFQKYNRLKNLSQGSLDFYAAKGRSFFRFLGDTEQPIHTIAFKEYTSETLKKQKRESVRQKLEKVKEELSNHRQLKKEKKREQEPIR